MSSHDSHPVVLVLGQAGAVSGGDVHAFRLAEGWYRAGASVELVGSPDLPQFLPQELQSIIVSIPTPFDARMRSSAVALAAGVAWRGIKAIKHCRHATVVVAGSHLIFDTAPAAVAHFLMRKPVVTYVYHVIGDMDRPTSLRTVIAGCLERISLALLRAIRATVFVDNEHARASLLRRGFHADRLHPTGNAYDPHISVPEPAPAAPGRLLFVGRMVEQKGIWDVVELGRRLKSADSDLQIDVVGDGPLRDQVTDVVDKEQLSNVNVLGFVDEETKWRLLSASRLFLAPSREEGWGIAVGEALLAGLPVVALDLPAYGHFSTQLLRTAVDGSDFVEVAFDVATDEQRLQALAEETQRARNELPRWNDVISNDLVVMQAIQENPRAGVRRRLRRLTPGWRLERRFRSGAMVATSAIEGPATNTTRLLAMMRRVVRRGCAASHRSSAGKTSSDGT